MKAVRARIRPCQKCGTRNRVGRYSIRLRPLCGRCKAPLSEPLSVTFPRFARLAAVKARTRRGSLLLGTALGATLTFLVSGPYRAAHESSRPATLQSDPGVKPPLPPSSLRDRDLQNNETELGRRAPSPAPQPAAPPSVKIPPRPPPVHAPSPIPPIEYADTVNGFVFYTALGEGHGRLTIMNGTRLHAIAKLVDPKQEKSVHTVLIRSNQQKITDIAEAEFATY